MLIRALVTRSLLAAALALSLAVASTGCGTTCDREVEKEIEFRGGCVDSECGANLDGNGSLYETSPQHGRYLHFPAGRRFRLVHGLSGPPPVVIPYVAFQERPLPTANVAPSAGNQVVIEAVDNEVIVVRNDTCSEFYLRVVAWLPQVRDAGISDGP